MVALASETLGRARGVAAVGRYQNSKKKKNGNLRAKKRTKRVDRRDMARAIQTQRTEEEAFEAWDTAQEAQALVLREQRMAESRAYFDFLESEAMRVKQVAAEMQRVKDKRRKEKQKEKQGQTERLRAEEMEREREREREREWEWREERGERQIGGESQSAGESDMFKAVESADDGPNF